MNKEQTPEEKLMNELNKANYSAPVGPSIIFLKSDGETATIKIEDLKKYSRDVRSDERKVLRENLEELKRAYSPAMSPEDAEKFALDIDDLLTLLTKEV